MCLGDPNCKCNLISDVRAIRDQELAFSSTHARLVPDDERTKNARANLALNPDDFNLVVALGDALAFQMRYNEAIECFEKACAMRPDDYAVRRKRAGRYLTTLNLDKAEKEFAWCLEKAQDKLDPLYMSGCCKYYQGEYEKAKSVFDECVELARDNGDMYVASLFWAIACDVQLGKSVADDIAKFHGDIQIGHHTGYLQTLKLFAGAPLAECDNIPKEDELQLCIFTYGVHLYYKHEKNAFLADAFLAGTLKLDTYFSAFAYLGAYTEYIRQKGE